MRRGVLAPLAFCYLVSVTGVSAAPDAILPDAQALRTLMRDASGPPNPDYRDTISVGGDGGPAIVQQYQRGDDARFTVTRGPIRTSYGTSAGADWHQDANGVTAADAPDPDQPARRKTTPTVERAAGRHGDYILSDLDAGGYGARDYIDSDTHLLMRHDEIGIAGTTITTYAGYARYGTQMLPASWRMDDRPLNERTTFRRTQFVAGRTSRADVAVPTARRLVAWPSGTSGVDLHAAFEDGKILIPVRIGGRSFFFLLDSGASVIAIDPAVARTLGLAVGNKRRAIAGRRFEAHDTIIPALDVGGLTMHDVVASTVPLGNRGKPSDPAGLLGFDFLAQLAIHIDYEHERVLASDARSFVVPGGADVSAIDVRLGAGVPMVSANLGGALAERLIVDTGSGSALLLFDHFARRHGELLRFGLDRAHRALGIGGSFASRPYRVPYVRIGRYSVADLVADVVTSRGAYPQENDGLIGSDLLQFFTIDFDYARGKIFLRARPQFTHVAS